MKKLKTVLLSTALIGLSSKALMGVNWDSQDWSTELASQLAGTAIASPSPYITALENLSDYQSDFQSIWADTNLRLLIQGSVLDQIKILQQLASIPESNRDTVFTMATNLAGHNSVSSQDILYTMMHLGGLSNLQLTQLQTTLLSIDTSSGASLHDLTYQAVSVLPKYPLDATEADLTWLNLALSSNASLSLALLQRGIGTDSWQAMITQNTNILSISALLSYFYTNTLSPLSQAAQISAMQDLTAAAQASVFQVTGTPPDPLNPDIIVTYLGLWNTFSSYTQLFQGLTGPTLRSTLDLFNNEYAIANISSLMSPLISSSLLGSNPSFNAALVAALLNNHATVNEPSLSAAAQAQIFQDVGDSLSSSDGLHYLNLWTTFSSYTQLFQGLEGSTLRATLDLFNNDYAGAHIASLMSALADSSLLGSNSSFNAELVSTLLNDQITSLEISPIISWINVDSESAANTIQKILLAVGVNANNLSVTGSPSALIDQLFDSSMNPADLPRVASILQASASNSITGIFASDMGAQILMAGFLIKNNLTYQANADTKTFLNALLILDVTPQDFEDSTQNNAIVSLAATLTGNPATKAQAIKDMLTSITLHSSSHVLDPNLTAQDYIFYANNQSAVDVLIAASNSVLPFNEAIAIAEENASWGENQVLDQYAYPILPYIEEVLDESLATKQARYAILQLLQSHGILVELGITQAKIVVDALLANGTGLSSLGSGLSGANPLDLAPTTSAADFLKGLKLAAISELLGISNGLSSSDQKALIASINKSVIFEELNAFNLISINLIFNGVPGNPSLTSEERALKLKEYLLEPLWSNYADAKARLPGVFPNDDWSTAAVDDFKNNPILRIAYDAALSDGVILPLVSHTPQDFFGSWTDLKTFLQDYGANGSANAYIISVLAATGDKDTIWSGFEDPSVTVDMKAQLAPAYARGLFSSRIGTMTSWADIWLVIHPLEPS